MKININELKDTPKQVAEKYCVYGKPSEKVQEWINHHGFSTIVSGAFTNIVIPEGINMEECFEDKQPFTYVDGFSPNLNKHLHIGHASNFILAKAFQKLGVGEKFIANLGDTLTGEVLKEDALKAYLDICKTFDYHVDKIFFASEFSGVDNLIEGEGEYVGTKVFDIEGKKVVGVKSNGSTSYFYQDVALANELNAPTLYLTGSEQSGHFKDLKTMFPHVDHLALGLVSVNGSKMSSRIGNVIYLTEALEMFKEKFSNDLKLVWNVLSGYILKSVPGSSKSINLDQLDNPKMSHGLYLSYTLAKMKSATLEVDEIDGFHSQYLTYKFLKAKYNLQPNILFEALIDTAKEINKLYETHIIRDNEENKKLFKPLAEDLLHGMKKLGMYDVEKV